MTIVAKATPNQIQSAPASAWLGRVKDHEANSQFVLDCVGCHQVLSKRTLLRLVRCGVYSLGKFYAHKRSIPKNRAGLPEVDAARTLGAGPLDRFFRVTLPLGISFYTFQSMSYTIDVYRGEVKAMRNFIDFACFVSMFPQLGMGSWTPRPRKLRLTSARM